MNDHHPDMDALEPRPRLGSLDEAAVDAVLEQGFDPDAEPRDPRAARLTALLGRLDALPDAGPLEADPSLVDVTMARIGQFDRERERASVESRPHARPVVDSDPDVIGRVGPWARAAQTAAGLGLALAIGVWAGSGMQGTSTQDVQQSTAGLPFGESLAVTEQDARKAVDRGEPLPVPVLPGVDRSPDGVYRGILVAVPAPGSAGGFRIHFVPDNRLIPASHFRHGVEVLGPAQIVVSRSGG